MVASAFLNSCAMPADSSPSAARFSFSWTRCCSAASSVKSVSRQIAPLIFSEPRRIGEIVTPKCRVSPAGGMCSTSSRRKIFPVERHSATIPVKSEPSPVNPQHLLRRRIRRRYDPRGIHHQQPRRHVPRHFFAQPLRLFRALPFNLVQPLQLFLLLPQFLNHTLHRCGHKRRRVLRPGCAGREFGLLLLTPALKKLAQ